VLLGHTEEEVKEVNAPMIAEALKSLENPWQPGCRRRQAIVAHPKI
jgi:hypothetical protein